MRGPYYRDSFALALLGQVNEAENILLDGIDYSNKDEVIAAALFYQYVSEKGEDFLQSWNRIAETATDENDRPLDDQKLKCVTIDCFGVDYPQPEEIWL